MRFNHCRFNVLRFNHCRFNHSRFNHSCFNVLRFNHCHFNHSRFNGIITTHCIDYQYSVHVIGHYHKFTQFNKWKMIRNFQPIFFC
ncbi:MAG: hypothetical protein ACK6BZ_11125 [Candidatus Kapaibacterium sp.]